MVASVYFLISSSGIEVEGHRFILCWTQLVLWPTQLSCWHSAKAVEREEEVEEEVRLEREGDNFQY